MTYPDGTVSTVTPGPDPRFGMQSPVPATFQIRTPSGLLSTWKRSRAATLGEPHDPLSLASLTETVEINGRTFTSAFDAALRRLTFTTPEGRRSTATVDGQGRVTAAQIEGLEPLALHYDTRGRLATVVQGTGPDQRTLTLTWDDEGFLSAVTDPQGRTVAFERDRIGRILRQVLPDQRLIGFEYDPNGNVTSVTPPGRPGHGFGHTVVDQQNEYSPPELPQGPTPTVYAYNLDRQLIRVDRPDGRAVDLGYDEAGRRSRVTFSQGILSTDYSSTTGRLDRMIAPGGGTLSYTYDGFLRTAAAWTGPVSGSVQWKYDQSFRPILLTVNGTNPVALTWDRDDLLTGVGSLTLTRDPRNGLLTGTSLGSLTTSQTWNGFAEIINATSSFAGTPFYSTDYTRDSLGRITRKVETIGEVTDTYDYVYDLAGRLTDVLKNGASLSHYDYDANSNRLAHVQPSRTVTGTYDAQDRLLTWGDRTYTYTANGELATKSQNGHTVTYDYDELGNLRSVVLPEGTTLEYVIDGQNRRIGKRINGILVQGFLYQDQLEPIAELDGAGAVVARFIYGSRPNVPDMILKDGRTYRILSDHLGSPRLVVDAVTGAVAQRMDFDEFGRVILDTNPGFQPFGFAGGIYDRHTRLVRFGARDYDAEVGRWVGKDPIGFAGGDENLYVYVMNDPVNFGDPWGLAPFTNNSKIPIPYKPEAVEFQPPAIAYPGETVDADGIYSPPGTEKPICVKVPNNCDAVAHPDGNLEVSCGSLGEFDRRWSLPLFDEKFVPRTVTPDDLQNDNFQNWPDPYSGRNWPYERWPIQQ